MKRPFTILPGLAITLCLLLVLNTAFSQSCSECDHIITDASFEDRNIIHGDTIQGKPVHPGDVICLKAATRAGNIVFQNFVGAPHTRKDSIFHNGRLINST